MLLNKISIVIIVLLNFGHNPGEAVSNTKILKRSTAEIPAKPSIVYHSPAANYATLQAQESRPNGRRQSYSYAATQRPVSYHQSYDSGPIYHESNTPPQSYYREYRSPPSSYNVEYNERPRSSSYHSQPKRQQHRSSYNNQDSNEHRDGDEQSYGSDNNDHYDDNDGYGGDSNDYNHDADSHGDDDYGHSPSNYGGQDDVGEDTAGTSNVEY